MAEPGRAMGRRLQLGAGHGRRRGDHPRQPPGARPPPRRVPACARRTPPHRPAARLAPLTLPPAGPERARRLRHPMGGKRSDLSFSSQGGLMKALQFAAGLAAASAFAIASAQDKGPTDPQIAGIVVAANKIDVDAGKIARSQSKNKEVQQFAQQMITDHTAVNKQASDLAKKLNVKPAESDTSKSLKSAAKENEANLKKLKGAAFDKAYVDHEVAYHEQVLGAIDKVLIPNARNAEL